MSTDAGTIKLEKACKKESKNIKDIEWFLSKKQLDSLKFFDCKTDLRGYLPDL